MNWSKIIEEVMDYQDITLYGLSKIVRVFPAQLSALLCGESKTIGFEKGLRIIKLHPDFEKLISS